MEKLRKALKSCGAAQLSEFIGKEHLSAIQSMRGGTLRESDYVDIVIEQYGSQILTNKIIRLAVLQTFDSENIRYLRDGDALDSRSLSVEDLNKIKNSTWKKDNVITQRYLKLLSLSDEYLPTVREKTVSSLEVSPKFTLHPYQKNIKDRLIRFLLSEEKEILVHMPTGSGKTRTTMEALVDYWRTQANKGYYMIWLADSEELCTQAEETFRSMWSGRGDRPINILRLWRNHSFDSLPDTGGLIIASLQKLNSLRSSSKDESFSLIASIREKAQLVIVDEAHKSVAPKYMTTVEFIYSPYHAKLIGLTATPGRSNEEEIQGLVEFYGSNKITLTDEAGQDIADPITFLQDNTYLSRIERMAIPTGVEVKLTSSELNNISNTLELPRRVLEELSQNERRNLLIVKEVVSLCQEDHKIIVFACSVKHARLLADLLRLQKIKVKCILGNTPSADRIEYIAGYEEKDGYEGETVDVLVNYGVLTTGFDAPKTNAVVITRPTTSLVLYSQMIGRGIRGKKMGGTDGCVLVDLEDNIIGYPSEQKAFNYFNNHWS